MGCYLVWSKRDGHWEVYRDRWMAETMAYLYYRQTGYEEIYIIPIGSWELCDMLDYAQSKEAIERDPHIIQKIAHIIAKDIIKAIPDLERFRAL